MLARNVRMKCLHLRLSFCYAINQISLAHLIASISGCLIYLVGLLILVGSELDSCFFRLVDALDGALIQVPLVLDGHSRMADSLDTLHLFKCVLTQHTALGQRFGDSDSTQISLLVDEGITTRVGAVNAARWLQPVALD